MSDSTVDRTASGEMQTRLGSFNESIECLKKEIPASGLEAGLQTKILEQLQNIQLALSVMPPDMQVLYQSAVQLQSLVQSRQENLLAKHVLEKITPLLGKEG